MPDPVTTARSARESLARGLHALQGENVPPALVELAEPIAEAMGALHQIERSQGQALLPHADVALARTRTALSHLQAASQAHPAVVAATEAVAGSLGLVHSLAKLARTPATGAPPQPPVQQTAYQPPAAPPAAQPYGAPPQPYAQQAPPPYAPQAPQPYAQQAPQRQPFKPGAGPVSAGSPLAATFATADPFGPGLVGGPQPPGNGVAAGPQGSQRPPSPPTPGGDVPVISADLGTHSPTNFYKGLSGNDIVDHGGLFVSTYMIPKIGTPVRLKISLPGGYEFEANGVVRWSREASDGGGGAPPGFGAQLTGITQEARQLVYRYARNREPLFHDDL